MYIVSQTAHTLQLAEFRDHCRIPWTDDDPALQRSLDAAVRLWEASTNWYIRTTRVRFNAYAGLCIPGGPSLALTEVFKQIDGVDDTDVTSSWFLEHQYGGWKLQAKRQPTVSYNPHDTYRADVTYSGVVSDAVKMGIYDWAHLLFREREGMIVGTSVSKIPMTLQSIVQQFQRGIA